MANNSDTKPCCSFCRKSNEQVRRLLSGPPGVYICNECIVQKFWMMNLPKRKNMSLKALIF